MLIPVHVQCVFLSLVTAAVLACPVRGERTVVCPASIEPVTARLTQVYDGKRNTFDWSISPTNTSGVTPDGSHPCNRPVYVGQYSIDDDRSCLVSADRVTRAPAVVAGRFCEFYVTDGSSALMTIRLSCNESATQLSIDPVVSVTNTIMENLAYSFTGSYAGVCSNAPTPTTTTTSDPEKEEDAGDGGVAPLTIALIASGAVAASLVAVVTAFLAVKFYREKKLQCDEGESRLDNGHSSINNQPLIPQV